MQHLDTRSYSSDVSCLLSFYYQINFERTKLNICVYFLSILNFLDGTPFSICYFFVANLSIVHHIPGTVQRVIMIFGAFL